MDKFAHTINDLVDAHDENVDENNWFKGKLADLGDRSRWNNVKKLEGYQKWSNNLNYVNT